MASYAKLYSFEDSSIMEEDVVIRFIFLWMLGAADFNGYFDGSSESMARRANVKPEDMKRALEKFQSPDPDSKSKLEEGKRIIYQGANRWWIVNFVEYRLKESDGTEYQKQQWRLRAARKAAADRGEELDEKQWHRDDAQKQGAKGKLTGVHAYKEKEEDEDEGVCSNSSTVTGNSTGITEATPRRQPVSKNPPTVADVHEQILSRGVKADGNSLRLAKQIVDHHASGGDWKTSKGKPIYVWKSHVNQWVESRLGGAGEPGRLTPDVKQMFRDQDIAKAHEKKLVKDGRIKR